MKTVIFTLFLSLFPVVSEATEIYKCNKNGSVIFQSKPCSGHTGKTTADKLKEEQIAREVRLSEIKEKEEKLQERLSQPTKKPSTFETVILNIRNYFSNFFEKIKRLFSVE